MKNNLASTQHCIKNNAVSEHPQFVYGVGGRSSNYLWLRRLPGRRFCCPGAHVKPIGIALWHDVHDGDGAPCLNQAGGVPAYFRKNSDTQNIIRSRTDFIFGHQFSFPEPSLARRLRIRNAATRRQAQKEPEKSARLA